VLGGFAAVVGVGALLALALGGSTVSTVAFADVPKQKDRVEVFGVLDRDSIRQLRGFNLVAFDLEEEVGGKKKTLTGRRLTVLYDNKAVGLPANFPAASHARATGYFDPSTKRLVSSQVATKCPSKYEPNGLDPATKLALEKWKNAGEAGVTAEDKAAPGTGAGASALPTSGVTLASRP